VLQTAGKNRIAMEDKEGSQRILLQTPVANSWIRLGAPNDPAPTPPSRPAPPTPTPTPSPSPTPAPSPTLTPTDKDQDKDGGSDGIWIYSEGPLNVVGAKADITILGEELEFVLGASQTIIAGNDAYIRLVTAVDVTLGWAMEWKVGHTLGVGNQTEWKMSQQGFHLEKVDVEGDVKKLAGHVVTLAGETSRLSGQVSDLATDSMTLHGSISDLSGQTRRLVGAVTYIHGRTDYINGEQEGIVGELIDSIGSRTEAIGQLTTALGEQTEVVVETTRTIAQETDVNVEHNRLAGLTNLT
jgi:type VI secretion system secreted protein VgrG